MRECEPRAYYKVISYGKLSEDAKKRNRTLFDKPGQPAEWGRRGVQDWKIIAAATRGHQALDSIHGMGTAAVIERM